MYIYKQKKCLVALPRFAYSSIQFGFMIAIGKITVQRLFFCDLSIYLLVEADLGEENLASGFVNIWRKCIASSAVLPLSDCGSRCSAKRGIPLLNKSDTCCFCKSAFFFSPWKSVSTSHLN